MRDDPRPDRPTTTRTRRWPALPTLCAVCGDWGDARVCRACVAAHAPPRWRCPRCALPLAAAAAPCGACLREPPPFAAAVAALDYAFPWNGLIAAFKYRAALDLADPLAARLAAAVHAARTDGLALPALVLPVPLAPQRLMARGHHPAWELTRRVAHALALPARARVLTRWLDGAHQVGHTRAERIAALRGAFTVEPAQAARWHGRTLALVDDVMTTGATAAEAARVLLAAGAASVQVWVVARTPPPERR